MTFASAFGRVLSPTFQPKSQAVAAGGSWWDLDGAITSCVAAYQPKGAASYAASKVNLANPGTHDATDGAAYPTWNSTIGWIFNGTTQYLKTGIIPSSANWSYIFRYSDPDANSYKRWWGAREPSTGISVGMENRVGNSVFYWMNGGTNTNQKTVTSAGWYAICGNTIYEPNGNTQSIVTGSIPQYALYIGAANNGGALLNPKGITFITFAIYNTVLSAAQVGAIATAMAAL